MKIMMSIDSMLANRPTMREKARAEPNNSLRVGECEMGDWVIVVLLKV